MEIAKALYLGGLVVHASDERLNFSYQNLGLRCCYCGEPVFYKHGEVNRPHFAHFPDVHPDKMAECLLRQKNQGYTYSWTDISSRGRQQRFRIFQKHFLELITWNLNDFENGYTLIQEKIPDYKLQRFVKDSVDEFSRRKENITLFYRLLQYKNTEISLLHRTIATEAIDYLCVQSSYSILVKLIYYSISIFLKNKTPLFLKYKECEKVCKCIADLIITVNWKEAFCSIPGYIYVEPQNLEKEFYRVLQDGCIYINGRNLVFIREVNNFNFEKHLLGIFLENPNYRYRENYPYDIHINVINKNAWNAYQENLNIFKNEILKSMQGADQKHPLPMPVANRKKLKLIPDKKEIRLQKKCIAFVEPKYQWHTRKKLELKHFLDPKPKYKLFLEFCPEGQQALNELFDDWLSSFDIKIPFSIKMESSV